MKTEYIWYKNGKEKQLSIDILGERVTKKILSDTEYIEYDYYGETIRGVAYYKNNSLQRDGDKPAVVWCYKDGVIEREGYFDDGRYHREGDKPSIIEYNEDGSIIAKSYHRNGNPYTPNPKSI